VVPAALLLGWIAWGLAERARDEWTRAMYAAAEPWAIAATVVLFVSATAAVGLLLRDRRWLGIVVLAIGMVLIVDCAEDAFEEFSPRASGQIVAWKILAQPAARLYGVQFYDHTVPFYIGRTVKLVDYVDEFELGLRSEPGLAHATLDAFRADWVRPGDAIAIMRPGIFPTLRAQGLPMQILHDDPRRMLVRKP